MMICKRVALLAVLSLFLSTSGLFAAAEDPVLTYFDGGRMNMAIELNSMLVSGAGGSSILSGPAAPNQADPFSLFRGPAGMRYIRGDAKVGFTFQPQLLLPFSSLPGGGAQTAVDEAVDGFTENFNKTDNFEYPEFGGSFSRSVNSFSSFGMVLPAGKWRVGFGYAKPFHLKLDLLLGGFRQRIDTVEDNPDEQIGFAIQTKISNRMEMDSDKWVLALSRDLGSHFSLGASASRTIIEFGWLGGYNVDGIMTRGTQQYTFNNPLDPWYNNLHSEANGGYTGFLYTYHIGAIFSSSRDDGWRIGADLALNTQTILRGSMFLLVDEFPPLKLQTEDDEEPFDANRIADVTEITRTYPNRYLTAGEMNLSVPSSVALTISKGGGARPNFTYIHYFGGAFAYELDVSEKRIDQGEYSTRTYSRGVLPEWQAYLAIHPGRFFLGLGAISAKDVVEGYVDGNGEPIPGDNALLIPRFDMGFSFPIKGGLSGELLVTGLPEDVFRVALLYDF
ncbi:hypothetical protein KQI63_00565 [bacterium]|nr:hypothetical protein [bacterium]